MNCIIVEDQLPAQRILKKYISDSGSLQLVAVCSDAMEALQVLQSEKVDIMFLDIHLPKISGIDFLKTLQQAPQVILTTAFQDYALESYELNVVDYLLKPFSFQRFLQAVAKTRFVDNDSIMKSNVNTVDASLEQLPPKEVYIKSGYDFIRVKVEDIIYILKDLDYTELHLEEKKYVSSESLRHWVAQLSSDKFVRVHKSYVINTSKIVKVSGNQVFLENNSIIPIGRAYKHDFVARFMP